MFGCRELQYSIQYGKVDHDVKALLVQKLPSGVYMDEYQLANLREDTGLEVTASMLFALKKIQFMTTVYI